MINMLFFVLFSSFNKNFIHGNFARKNGLIHLKKKYYIYIIYSLYIKIVSLYFFFYIFFVHYFLKFNAIKLLLKTENKNFNLNFNDIVLFYFYDIKCTLKKNAPYVPFPF